MDYSTKGTQWLDAMRDLRAPQGGYQDSAEESRPSATSMELKPSLWGRIEEGAVLFKKVIVAVDPVVADFGELVGEVDDAFEHSFDVVGFAFAQAVDGVNFIDDLDLKITAIFPPE